MSGNNKFFIVSRLHCKILPATVKGGKKVEKMSQIKHDLGLAVREKSDSFAEKYFPFAQGKVEKL